MHVCDTSTLSPIAQNMKEHVVMFKVVEELCQGLVNVQCMKPSEMVTTTTDVLDEFGLKENATQLRGWLVCQSLSGK